MKKSMGWVLLCLAAGAGCTTAPLSSLRDESLVRDQRRLTLTHAQIQKALLQHAQHCGRGPTFTRNAASPNEASIVYAVDDPPQTSRTVLVDLQQIYGWGGPRTAATAYASFSVSQQEVARVFDAVLEPAVCPAR